MLEYRSDEKKMLLSISMEQDEKNQVYLHFKYPLFQFDIEFLEMSNRSGFNLKIWQL